MLQITVHPRLEDISADHWQELHASDPDATVFQTAEWSRAWWQACGTGRQLHLIAIHDADRLVALAPLYLRDSAEFGRSRPQLSFLGDGHSDYQQPLIRQGSRAIAIALIDHLQRQVAGGTKVVLEQVPQFSPLALELNDRRDAGRTGLRLTSQTVCPRLHLRADPARVDAVLRKESLRRHAKRVAELGPVRITHRDDIGGLRALLPLLFELHIARWAGSRWPSLFNEPANRRFYEQLVEHMPPGQVIGSLLEAGGTPIAVHFGLRSGNEFLWYKPAFDVRHAARGPGEVLLKLLIEYARNRGCEVFDFTRGDEQFKRRFASAFEYNLGYEWVPATWDQTLARGTQDVRRVARKVRDRWIRRERTLEHRANAERVLIAGKDESQVAPIAAAFAAHGVHADAQVCPLDEPSEQQLRKLRALHAEWKYRLIVPVDESLTRDLIALGTEASMRQVTLLPNAEALAEVANCMRLARVSETSTLRTLECLCSAGSLVWYYAPRVADEQITAIGAIRRALARLRWHGLATVHWTVDSAEAIEILRIVPVVREAFARNDSRDNPYVTATLRIAAGEPAGSQPGMFRIVQE